MQQIARRILFKNYSRAFAAGKSAQSALSSKIQILVQGLKLRCSRNSSTSSAFRICASASGSRSALLAVYRLGAHIPTPGIDAARLSQYFNQNSGGALGLLDLFNGGNLRKLTVFALGIMPYITASIIFQLLTVIYEPLAKLQKEGELGRRKITQWTRYVTVLLAVVQSFVIGLTLTSTATGETMVTISKGEFLPLCVITLTAGTAFIMWLGEQITERGIGNGMSLLIFTGIVVGLPRGIADLYQKAATQAWGGFTPIAIALLVVMMVAVVAFIVFVERSERRIPVQ